MLNYLKGYRSFALSQHRVAMGWLLPVCSVPNPMNVSAPMVPVLLSNQGQHSIHLCQKPTLAHAFLRAQPQESAQNLWLATASIWPR